MVNSTVSRKSVASLCFGILSLSLWATILAGWFYDLFGAICKMLGLSSSSAAEFLLLAPALAALIATVLGVMSLREEHKLRIVKRNWTAQSGVAFGGISLAFYLVLLIALVYVAPLYVD